MKVSKLIETLSKFDSDDNVTFYFLKNDTLTNCQLEDIGFFPDMGIEFTIQDTSELFEEADSVNETFIDINNTGGKY